MIRAAVAIALGSASVGRAQNTETLGRADRPLQFQVSAGMIASLAFDGSRSSDLSVASISIRHPVDGGLVGLRAAVWATDWRPHCTAYLCGDEVGRSRLIVTMLMADWPIHLPYDLAFEPIAGAGVAPYSQTTFPPNSVQGDRRMPPYVFSAGVGLRWRWLVVEQHAFLITNSNDYFHNTLAPLTVGVRF